MGPTRPTIEDLLQAQASGALSAAQILEASFDRIEARDGALNCFVRLAADAARSAAESIDDRRRRGDPVGPLAGIPVGLKDSFITLGLQTSCASRILDGFVPPFDGTHAQRLRGADALLVGKLNMDEFAMGSSTEHSVHGPTANPWDLQRVPGGSSGGSAAAVAAGLVPASLGSDTGGSIRQPASFCGVVGVKPTYGRVSRYGLVAFASSLDQAGPLATTVRGCARVLQVIGGPDERDSTCWPEPQPDYLAACERGVEGLRVGLPREYFGPGLAPEVAERVHAAVAQLEALGASVQEVSLPSTEHAVATYYLIAPAEASSNLARYDGVRFGRRCDGARDVEDLYSRSRGEGFGPEVTRRIMLGAYALSAGYYDQFYRKALAARAVIRQEFLDVFRSVDVLASPVAPTAAFPRGARLDDPLQMYLSDVYTIPSSLAGLPGVSVPCGFTPAGLPVGLQLLAAPFDEERLFAAAAAYQGATEHHLAAPEPAPESAP